MPAPVKIEDINQLKAREQYIQHCMYPSVIAQNLGVHTATVNRWVAKYGWDKERQNRILKYAHEVAIRKKHVITEVTDTSLNIINISLQRMLKDLEGDDKKQLKTSELKFLSELATNLDKLMRLDEGLPTDITQQIEPVTIDRLKEALAKDVFIEVNDESVFDKKGVSTNWSIGLADRVEIQVPEGTVEVQVTVPSRYLSDRIEFKVSKTVYVRAIISDDNLELAISEKMEKLL